MAVSAVIRGREAQGERWGTVGVAFVEECEAREREKRREEASHSQKAGVAQRSPGALRDEALRTTGFPARGTRKPGRYAIDAIVCATSGGDDTPCAAEAQGRLVYDPACKARCPLCSADARVTDEGEKAL